MIAEDITLTMYRGSIFCDIRGWISGLEDYGYGLQYLWNVVFWGGEEPTDSCKMNISTKDGNANLLLGCKALQALHKHIALMFVCYSAPCDVVLAD